MFNLKKVKPFLMRTAVAFAAALFIGTTAHAATYKVVEGDSLYKIGNLFKTTSSAIMKSSGLTSSAIYPGQTLTIPGDVYTVKSGDTLYIIAKRYGISLYSLARAIMNGMVIFI